MTQAIAMKTEANKFSFFKIGTLHPAQAQVYKALTNNRPPKISVLACGARWGKDRLCMFILLYWAFRLAFVEKQRRDKEKLIPRVLCWYVAPSFSLLRQAWDEITEFTSKIPGVKFNRAEVRVYLPNGIQIELKSADRPGSLVSRGIDLVICTEAARMKKEAWENGVITRLASPGRGPDGKGGLAILNSTPNGKNWFFDLWNRAYNDNTGYMKAWQFSSYDNPGISRRLLDAQKEILPERVFMQEYLAQFIDGGGSVFRRVSECLEVYEYPAKPRGAVCIGVDWGRHNDRTAIVVICIEPTGKYRLIEHRLLLKTPYNTQITIIKTIAQKYPACCIIAEVNGLGDPLVESLRLETHRQIIPFITTSASKKAIIETAVSLMESGAIVLPAYNSHGVLISIAKDLTDELSQFECIESRGGGMKYTAPDGAHDDLTMAFCFAISGRQAVRKSGRIEAI